MSSDNENVQDGNAEKAKADKPAPAAKPAPTAKPVARTQGADRINQGGGGGGRGQGGRGRGQGGGGGRGQGGGGGRGQGGGGGRGQGGQGGGGRGQGGGLGGGGRGQSGQGGGGRGQSGGQGGGGRGQGGQGGGGRGQGGGKGGKGQGGGRRGRGRGKDRDEQQRERLVETVVRINRCATVVKGGRRFSFSALVVVGDEKGRVGVGYGKAKGVPDAVEKAVKKARADMRRIPIVDGTIPHEVLGIFGAARVVLMPASPGTGVIAGATTRAVVEGAGIKNILTKSLGSPNPVNLVRATINGLRALKTRDSVEKLRGIKLQRRAGSWKMKQVHAPAKVSARKTAVAAAGEKTS